MLPANGSEKLKTQIKYCRFILGPPAFERTKIHYVTSLFSERRSEEPTYREKCDQEWIQEANPSSEELLSHPPGDHIVFAWS